MRNATKRLLAFVLAAVMILALAPAQVRAAANENLALNRPATASNVEAGTSFTADKAVDGLTGTRWATDQNVSNPWIEIDLEDGSVVKQIDIMFERGDDGQNILGYRIEAYANGAYTTIYTHEGGRCKQRVKIILPEAVSADKLKVTVTDYDGGSIGWASVSICEIEVYADEFKSLSDIAAELSAMAGTVIEGDTLPLPELPAGFTVEMNGADLQQIIGNDMSIIKPLVDKTVNVSFKVSDGNAEVVTGDIPVIVKGQHEQPMEGNPKPQVIPEIQEWYSDTIYRLPISELKTVP